MSKPSHFVQRLYHALEKAPVSIFHWTDDGTAFVILDRDLFTSQILHAYFKYTKFTSFERRLRLHGFRRRSFASQSPSQRVLLTFQHPHFMRDNRSLLRLITVPTQGETPAVPIADDSSDLTQIYSSIDELQQQITSATSKLNFLVQYVMASPPDNDDDDAYYNETEDDADSDILADDEFAFSCIAPLPVCPSDFSVAECPVTTSIV
ncbi:hypothetical protein SPRG_12417 [Saprolegnia parasitica CBS 223.65]|uniref:HSF-type DNA-binding domain-containing protein n=1 Tax=Saprolegnia parasitica (strain CBS 223.65) TaxID=695850 RepID=A0A067BX35_SAPPC|nr:hypothetical protein SPRG_12417 [Saprolegnia parasitica CBS 223.65]KDO21410.1 hypothetical protein SPRG_12417 [Saprolegnia parasitica CBS 223.65]|eukprot:XP_012207857.1 hypothetical protein SPRG_12417 [Saprolegnia parasitica CBS 223.65]